MRSVPAHALQHEVWPQLKSQPMQVAARANMCCSGLELWRAEPECTGAGNARAHQPCHCTCVCCHNVRGGPAALRPQCRPLQAAEARQLRAVHSIHCHCCSAAQAAPAPRACHGSAPLLHGTSCARQLRCERGEGSPLCPPALCVRSGLDCCWSARALAGSAQRGAAQPAAAAAAAAPAGCLTDPLQLWLRSRIRRTRPAGAAGGGHATVRGRGMSSLVTLSYARASSCCLSGGSKVARRRPRAPAVLGWQCGLSATLQQPGSCICLQMHCHLQHVGWVCCDAICVSSRAQSPCTQQMQEARSCRAPACCLAAYRQNDSITKKGHDKVRGCTQWLHTRTSRAHSTAGGPGCAAALG